MCGPNQQIGEFVGECQLTLCVDGWIGAEQEVALHNFSQSIIHEYANHNFLVQHEHSSD